MSPEYLLSCYERGPSGMCGCRGADLPTALKVISELGMVSFSQFPYVSSDVLNLPRREGIDVVYFCGNSDHLGTCRPCKASLEDYSESVLSASPDVGAFRFVVPCLPCAQPVSPKYFPVRPFVLGGGDLRERVAVVKAELVRIGPLCFALAIDSEGLTSLLFGGTPPSVTQPHEGLFYRPRRIVTDGSFYTALIMGYSKTPSNEPFWVCHLQVSGGGFGYELKTGSRVVGGLFNVDMEDEVVGTLSRVVSFEEMRIQTVNDGSPRSLRRGDPFLADLASARMVSNNVHASGVMTASLRREARKGWAFKHAHWLIYASVACVALVLLWVVVSFKGSQSTSGSLP